MHIVIVSDYALRSGGAEKVAIDSAVALAGAGHNVHFLTGVGPIDPELEATGVTVHLANVADLKGKGRVDSVLSGLWSEKCATMTAQLLRKLPKHESIIHVHAWQRALTAATLRACRESGHPIVMTLHEYGTACPNQGFFDYQREEICTRRALGVACLTTHCDTRTYGHKLWRVARTAAQQIGASVPRGIHDVIYMTEHSRRVLTPYFNPATHWHHVRNPIFVPQEPRVAAEGNETFLFVGRITREKGVHLLASAARLAHVPTTFVGDGPDLPALRTNFPELNYTGWLTPNGAHDAMRNARALVFPSYWYEVQPLVVQEALACGVPVIVADRTAASEAVRDGETGLLFRHMEEPDLTKKLRRLADDGDFVAGLSRNAYEQYWSDPPTIENHVSELISVYRTSLDRWNSNAGSA